MIKEDQKYVYRYRFFNIHIIDRETKKNLHLS